MIHTVIITYNPNKKILKKCIDSLLSQVDKIYIIDNDSVKKPIFKSNKIKLIRLDKNIGIAAAQNLGIKKALSEKARYILLSDQDTIYPPNYVRKMLTALKKINNNEKIIAIVPNFRDINNNKNTQGFIRFTGLKVKKIFPQKGNYEITQAISSGMILNAKFLSSKTFMNELLFIDWVDLEWSWRVRCLGYKIIGVADINIYHILGDKRRKIFKWEFPIRNYIRHYYIVRNAIYLAIHNKYINFLMRVNLFFKSVLYIFIYTYLGDTHYKDFIYTIIGFYHGLIGKLGKLDEK